MTRRTTDLRELLGRFDGGELEADESWVNSWGVVFGGVSAAALLAAWDDLLPADRVLSSAHLSFDRPLRRGPASVHVEVAGAGRTVTRLTGAVAQADSGSVQGFAIAARHGEGSTSIVGAAPDVPSADDLPEAVDRAGRTADFIERHVEIRVTRRPARGERVVHQWVRLRDLEPDGAGRLPLAALGLLADLASVGVFRTAVRELEGLHAVKALDLGLHLTGRPPTTWTLMAIDTPPIQDGAGTAHAALYDSDGAPLAVVAQQTLVQPLQSD